MGAAWADARMQLLAEESTRPDSNFHIFAIRSREYYYTAPRGKSRMIFSDKICRTLKERASPRNPPRVRVLQLLFSFANALRETTDKIELYVVAVYVQGTTVERFNISRIYIYIYKNFLFTSLLYVKRVVGIIDTMFLFRKISFENILLCYLEIERILIE